MRPTAVLLVAALLLLALTSCGGPPPEARHALEDAARAWNFADEALARHVRTRGEEVRAAILADPTLTTVEAGLAAFDARMAPERDAAAGLRSARAGLYGVEAGLDAWQAGSGAEGFLAAVPCAIVAFAALADALRAAGVPSLPEIDLAIAALGAWAGHCEGGAP